MITVEEAGALRLLVRGELDLSTASRLEEAVAAAEARAPRGPLVLDLSGLGFMDSTGLQVLLDVDLRAEQAERELAVLAGDGAVRRVLELADVLPRLRVTDVR